MEHPVFPISGPLIKGPARRRFSFSGGAVSNRAVKAAFPLLFFSSLFSDTRYSLAFGAGIPTLMYVLQMLADAGDKAADLRYATFFTLYNPNGLASGDLSAFGHSLILLFGALLLYTFTSLVFCNKNFSI